MGIRPHFSFLPRIGEQSVHIGLKTTELWSLDLLTTDEGGMRRDHNDPWIPADPYAALERDPPPNVDGFLLLGGGQWAFTHAITRKRGMIAALIPSSDRFEPKRIERSMPDFSLVHRMTAYMAWADDVMLKNAEHLPDAELSDTIAFEFVGGGDGAMDREDILLHLVNHATYHRGFVSTLLYPLATKGAASDLTVFLRDVWPDINITKR